MATMHAMRSEEQWWHNRAKCHGPTNKDLFNGTVRNPLPAARCPQTGSRDNRSWNTQRHGRVWTRVTDSAEDQDKGTSIRVAKTHWNARRGGGGVGVALRAMHAWLRRTGGAGGGLGLSVRLSGELDKHGRLAEGPGLCVGAGAVLGKGLGGCLGVSGGKRLLERLCGSGGVGAALGLAAARGAGDTLRRRLCRGLHARALCHGCDNKPRRRGRLLPGTRSPDTASTAPGLTAVTGRLQARSAG